MPLHTIVLPGLGFHGTSRETLKVLLQASFGYLSILADVSEGVVQGCADVVDMMNFTGGTCYVRFPATIRQLHLPKLFDSRPDNSIRNMVTIAIKAFLHYHKLRILLKNIKQYYPDTAVIVADDSEHPEKTEKANVQHYIMPFGKGWFAGKSLAISQVTTKYYLWVDDDFTFTEKTNIKKFMDVLEKSNLDVVGGSVDGNEYKFKMFCQEGEDSSCLYLRSGFYYPLEGFPNYMVTSGVTNFFLAHTEESRRVGFDPKLQRVAHLEFFMDGLGSLQVGSCNDVIIGHQSHQISTNILRS